MRPSVVEVLVGIAIVGIVVVIMILAAVHRSREAATKLQAVHIGGGIYKMCDEGNAIYIGGGGLAVVQGGCPR